MRQQPRLSAMNKIEIQRYREIRDSIRRGRIPVWLINPIIVSGHNDMSPAVAQLTAQDEVSLDMLAVLVSGDMDTGIEARRHCKHMLQKQIIMKEPSELTPEEVKFEYMLDQHGEGA